MNPIVSKFEDLVNQHYAGYSANIEDRTKNYLSMIPVDLAIAAINEFENTLLQGMRNGSNAEDVVKNPSSFVISTCRRKSDEMSKEVIARAIATHEPPMGREMHPDVLRRIDVMVASGFCKSHEIDDRNRDMMSQITVSECIASLDELQATDRSKVKNIGGYYIGILRKYLRTNHGHGSYSHSNSNLNSTSYADRYIKSSNPSMSSPTPAGYAHASLSEFEPTFLQNISKTPCPEYFTTLPPAPPTMPKELFYMDDSGGEYAPEMPCPLDGKGLSPTLREGLEYCVQAGLCQLSDLDVKILSILQSLPDEVCIRVLKEYINADHRTIRSKVGYMVGIIRKFGIDTAKILAKGYDSRTNTTHQGISNYYNSAHGAPVSNTGSQLPNRDGHIVVHTSTHDNGGRDLSEDFHVQKRPKLENDTASPRASQVSSAPAMDTSVMSMIDLLNYGNTASGGDSMNMTLSSKGLSSTIEKIESIKSGSKDY